MVSTSAGFFMVGRVIPACWQGREGGHWSLRGHRRLLGDLTGGRPVNIHGVGVGERLGGQDGVLQSLLVVGGWGLIVGSIVH